VRAAAPLDGSCDPGSPPAPQPGFATCGRPPPRAGRTLFIRNQCICISITPSAPPCSTQCRSFVPLQSRCVETSIGRMISCRRRCCALAPTSKNSKRARTWCLGFARLCTTNIVPTIASAAGRSRTSTERYANTLAIEPDQITHLEYEDMRAALSELPNEMRQTLILIGVEGISYERAARACNCSVGTVKSRAHRARERLAAMLSIGKPGDPGGHPNGRSIASAGIVGWDLS